MSMDLFRSCSNVYSSYPITLHSLVQMEQQRGAWEVGETSSNGRLIQHSDGIVEVVPKTPGEVLGEKTDLQEDCPPHKR